MFDQVFENLQKATESSIKMQQDLFKNWMAAFPQAPTAAVPAPTDAIELWRHKWEELMADSLKRQKELVDKNYDAATKALESIFAVEDAKSPQDYQQKVTELYRQSFESLRQLSEAQMRDFKTATEKWLELMSVPS
ncbi:MAG: hypothetical protein KDB27_11615 [Planctomycetales bacterium]|nr:hypothetical protein [Planctomycetales bacterium]